MVFVMPSNPDLPLVVKALIVGAGSLVGAFFFSFCLVPVRMMGRPYTLADAAWDCSVVSVGALLGGLFFSWASKH